MTRQTYDAAANLRAKKRITKSVVANLVFESIHETSAKSVGVLSVEEVAKGWRPDHNAHNESKCWRVEVADSGKVYTLTVSITRRREGKAIVNFRIRTLRTLTRQPI